MQIRHGTGPATITLTATSGGQAIDLSLAAISLVLAGPSGAPELTLAVGAGIVVAQDHMSATATLTPAHTEGLLGRYTVKVTFTWTSGGVVTQRCATTDTLEVL